LLDTKEILDNHGIIFWLDSGTLLGAMRNGELLPWEHDIDVSIWRIDMEGKREAIFIDFRERGYNVLDTPHYTTVMKDGEYIDLCYYSHFSHKDHVVAVIPVYVERNSTSKFLCSIRTIFEHYDFYMSNHPIGKNSFVLLMACKVASLFPSALRGAVVMLAEHLLSIVGYLTWIIPSKWFEHLEPTTMYGQKFLIPSDYKGYLAYRYGKDWETPNKNWDNNMDGGLTRV